MKDPGFDVANLLDKVSDIDKKLNGYDEEQIKDFQKQKDIEEKEIKRRKIEWISWLLKNHPDKGGDTKILLKVEPKVGQ